MTASRMANASLGSGLVTFSVNRLVSGTVSAVMVPLMLSVPRACRSRV